MAVFMTLENKNYTQVLKTVEVRVVKQKAWKLKTPRLFLYQARALPEPLSQALG
jgi:hypothetical protein